MSAISENLDRFFPDGKTVILPIDHGTAIPVPGLENPGDLIDSVSSVVDGFVVNHGLLHACADQLSGKGICFRTDIYKPVHGDNRDRGSYQVFDSEAAAAEGANMVMNMCYPHHAEEARIFTECARLIAQRRETGIPVILESLPYGIGRPEDYTLENIGFAVRAAAELGADVVKTAYPTDADPVGFKKIIDACYVPVVVLGGAAMGDDKVLLKMVRDAMEAGAAGVAIGRNVWQHADPPTIAGEIAKIVHGS